jgi:hypothetical protein
VATTSCLRGTTRIPPRRAEVSSPSPTPQRQVKLCIDITRRPRGLFTITVWYPGIRPGLVRTRNWRFKLSTLSRNLQGTAKAQTQGDFRHRSCRHEPMRQAEVARNIHPLIEQSRAAWRRFQRQRRAPLVSALHLYPTLGTGELSYPSLRSSRPCAARVTQKANITRSE